jgi:hypothetical protein
MTERGTFFTHDGEEDVDMMDATSGFIYKEDAICGYKVSYMLS